MQAIGRQSIGRQIYRQAIRQPIWQPIGSWLGKSNPSVLHRYVRSYGISLPRPSLITVDAYDTLYTPRESIPKQYNEITGRFGVTIDEDQLGSRYRKAYKEVNGAFPNYGKYAGFSVDEFWFKVLSLLYSGSKEALGRDKFEKMIYSVINAFKTKEAYKVFEDFIDLARWAVEEEKIPFCVASNADAGVTHLVIEEFGMRRYLDKRDVYLSYDLEYWKPDPRFFEYIIDDRLGRIGCTRQDSDYAAKRKLLVDSMWHIGDEYDKDVECTLGLGIGAILVDRKNASGTLRPGEQIRRLGDKYYVVRSLSEVKRMFI